METANTSNDQRVGTPLVVVGEAWGREEEEAGGVPFVGWSGRLLKSILASKGIDWRAAHITNVFNLRPKPTNDIKNLCGKRADGIPGLGPLGRGNYVLAKYKGELDRLHRELIYHKPTLILALGSTALWAITGQSAISRVRGTTLASRFGKVLPTYHPAVLSRDWSLRPIFIADIEKAAREMQFAEVKRPQREVWIEPTLEDLYEFERQHIDPSPYLSIDIETSGDQITCIGFAPGESVSLVVPFLDKRRPDWNYWPDHVSERSALEWVRVQCSKRKIIVGQNFLYDLNFLWSRYGIAVPHFQHDTMLLHHALHPEMPKSLGMLGSLYTDEANWKIMREQETRKKEDT